MVVPATMQPDGDVDAVLTRYLRARKCALGLHPTCLCCREGQQTPASCSVASTGWTGTFSRDDGRCAAATQVQCRPGLEAARR